MLDISDDAKTSQRAYLEAFKRTMFGGEAEDGELEPGWEQRGVFDYLTKELLLNGVRHFDLPAHKFEEAVWSRLPYSFVDSGGEPNFYSSLADVTDYARVSVG